MANNILMQAATHCFPAQNGHVLINFEVDQWLLGYQYLETYDERKAD